ncbi:alpha-glucosidase [Aerococcus kribbianus]|uniref:Alpha-glucosidase n=1 Tax=Aerococcus kribbianus TaxID=2999064 RepID=A0A9X3FNH0_9LACT|nr:alpha-glucosidase [Aerococcus sp. YH-aer222]MCZ0725124.1 alpha-glucosidase [Aerococcus sp. YH-aer222]
MNLRELQDNWWKEEVIYQIYPQSFKDSNGDGIGDIQGIINELNYLHQLGITTIWISPIFSSPLIDNGYDISDYEDINPVFGTNDDLDRLIAKADELNIKIILDLVVNHSSDEHIWFKKALENKNSKYRNYYIIKESQDGTPPNNWRSIFGGSAWEPIDGEKNTYYLHTFHKKQPDLNWENDELRNEIYNMINRWLERGIAGFRIDSITFIKKDQDFNNLPSDGADNLANIKHKTRNRPGISSFLSELNEKTFKKYNVMTVGEAPGVPYSQFNDYIGKNGYFNMIFDFKPADIDVENGSEWFRESNWTYDEYINLVKISQEALQSNGWGANFIENHDQPRAVSKLIKDSNFKNDIGAKALAASYFFLRGTPFIYQGQELGMTNVEWDDISLFNDISSHDNYERALLEGFTSEQSIEFVQNRSRDNGRTPFPWTNEEYGGFSSSKPWIAMKEKYPRINTTNNTVLKFYQEMINLRQHSHYRNVLIFGEIKFISNVPNAVMAYTREDGNKVIASLTNFNSKKVEITINNTIDEIILNTHEGISIEENIISLEPMQSVLVELGGNWS